MKKHNSPQQRFLIFLDPLQRLSETDQVFLLEHSEVVSANKNEHLIHTGYGQYDDNGKLSELFHEFFSFYIFVERFDERRPRKLR